MAIPPLADDLAEQAVEAFRQHPTKQAAADALGLSVSTFKDRLKIAARRGLLASDPAITEAAKAGGIEDPRNLSHFWKISKDEDGNGYSLFVKNPNSGQTVSVFDMVREAVLEAQPSSIELPPRETPTGEHLLVIDLADVHFLKLSVKTETGYDANTVLR